MREILFRGYSKIYRKWFYGSYLYLDKPIYNRNSRDPVDTDPVHYIVTPDGAQHSVVPETVSQFTGPTDHNVKKIFEGDIFRIEDDIVGVVVFENGCFHIKEYGWSGTYTESGYDECGGDWKCIDCNTIDSYAIGKMEVIGNVHDNPELLKGE